MRTLRIFLLSVLTIGLLTGASYGAGLALRHHDGPKPATPAARVPSSTPTPTTPAASPSATPDVEQQDVLAPGAKGRKVRELQSRLFQIDWLPELTTGVYDATTRTAVRGFQAKRGLAATGTVDRRTWRRLLAMTEQPTRDQLFNVLHAGPAILSPGDSGAEVRDLQARLVAIQWLFGDVTGSYDDTTAAAVRGFQEKRQIPVTGEVDARTLDRLHAMTITPSRADLHNLGNQPGALDARCRTGRVLCIDKTSQTLRWVVEGKVLRTFDVRFGSASTPTREGVFSVNFKSIDHVSKLYGSAMPYAMFFSGGQAVHYSSDFVAQGYAGASHGCVNVRDRAGLAALFDEVRVGDPVVVYWS